MAIVLGLSGTGCAALTDSAHGTAYWTRRAIDDTREHHRNRTLADQAWAAAHRTAACQGATADYADGFKAGYADHLYRGTTQPPPLPPKHYRGLHYQTPDGFRAGANWLAGFRHGIEAAQGSGLRQLITGPSSLVTELTPGAGSPPIDPTEILPPPRLFDDTRLPPKDTTPPAVEGVRTSRSATPPAVLPLPVAVPAPASAAVAPSAASTPFVVVCGYLRPVERMRSGLAGPPIPVAPPMAGAEHDEVQWVPAGTLRPVATQIKWVRLTATDRCVRETAYWPADKPGETTAGGLAR